jgi:hypothetical protein
MHITKWLKLPRSSKNKLIFMYQFRSVSKLALLEKAWTLSDTAGKRNDVDERILALLSGEPVARAAAAGPIRAPPRKALLREQNPGGPGPEGGAPPPRGEPRPPQARV